MSMLAAPRRKQKWTLNPRGKQWSEDSGKFGQKMLEKMGWSNGKGLGAQEQGSVEHIRVRVKNDQVGIGFTKNRDDLWSEHQDGFNSLLQNLQKEQSADNQVTEENNKVLSGKSLEEKSKHSQKRVHYRKFIRGKDVNKYTPKDLANIFGKRDLNEKYVKSEDIDTKEENEKEICDPIGAKDSTAGIITIKGGNMNDYFKNKSFNTPNKKYNNQDKDSCESETEKYAGFGSSVKSKSKFYVNNDASSPVKEDSESESGNHQGFGSKIKKHNNLNYVFDNPCLDLNILDNDSPISKKVKNEVKDSIVSNTLTIKKRKSESTYENEEECMEYSNKTKTKKRKSEIGYKNEILDLEYSDKSETLKQKEEIKDKSENFVKYKYEETVLDLPCLDKITPKKSKKIKNESLTNVYENHALDLEFTDKLTPKNTIQNENNLLSNVYDNRGLDLEFPDKSETLKQKDKCKDKSENFLKNKYEETVLELPCLDKITPKKSKKIKNESLTNVYENHALDLEFTDKLTPKNTIQNENNLLSNVYDNRGLDLEYLENTLKNTEQSESNEFDLEPLKKLKKKKSKKNKSEPLPDEIENVSFDKDFPENLTKAEKEITIQSSSKLSKGYDNFGLNLEDLNKSTPTKINKNEIELAGYENLGLDLKSPDTSLIKNNNKIPESEHLSGALENPGFDLDVSDPLSLKKRKNEKNSESLTITYENVSLQTSERIVPTKPKRSKKNKRLSTGLENPALDLEISEIVTPKKHQKYKDIEGLPNVFDNPTLDLTCSTNEIHNVADFEVSRTTLGVENNALDLSDENTKKKRVTFNDQVEYSTDIVKKKKKKKKLDKYEVVNEKLKKIDKVEEPAAFVNEGLDIEIINEEEIDNELNERKSKKLKRRKDRRISLLETIEESPEEENMNQSPKIVERTVQTKENKNEVVIVNEIVHENVLEDVEECEDKSPLKKKKKKKNKTLTEDYITIDESGEINSTVEKIDLTDISEESNTARKKKKKKHTKEKTENVVEIDSGVDDVDKENVCIEKDEIKKKKRKSIPADEDKISLQEFLSEESQKVSDLEIENEPCTAEGIECETDYQPKYTKAQYKAYQKSKTSKQKIKEYFLKNPVINFPGSNINEIAGYGYE